MAPAGAAERAAAREVEWAMEAPVQEARAPHTRGPEWGVETPAPEWVGIRAHQVEWVVEALAPEWGLEKVGTRARPAERAGRVPVVQAPPGLRAEAAHPEWVVAEVVRPVVPEAEASSENREGLAQ